MATDAEHRILERTIDELPVLPTVLTEVIGLDAGRDDTFDRLVALAESDPPFAARLIHLANSARYARRGGSVLDVRGATARLGSRATSELLTSLAVARVFVPTTPGQRRLWLHAIQVALAARRIAKELRTDLDLNTLYLGALLHDLGRFLLFETSPEELGQIDEIGYDTPEGLIAAEHAVCGTDHATLGALAAEAWRLPDWLTRLIANHHRQLPRVDRDIREAVRILQLADYVGTVLCQVELGEPTADAAQQVAADALRHTPTPISELRLAPIVLHVWRESYERVAALGL